MDTELNYKRFSSTPGGSVTLAPERYGRAAGTLYVILRTFHLTAAVATLPLALLYLITTSSILAEMHDLSALVIIAGALFWALLYIAIEQYSYPMDLPRGILVSGSLILNAVSGSFLSGAGFLHGFYHVFMGALCAQILVLVTASAWFIHAKRKRNAVLTGISLNYLWLPVAMLLSLGVMVWQFHPPLLRELAGGSDLSLRALACFSFLFQVYFDITTLKDGSIFRKARGDDSARNRIHGAWGGLCAAGVIASLLAAAAVMLEPLSHCAS